MDATLEWTLECREEPDDPVPDRAVLDDAVEPEEVDRVWENEDEAVDAASSSSSSSSTAMATALVSSSSSIGMDL